MMLILTKVVIGLGLGRAGALEQPGEQLKSDVTAAAAPSAAPARAQPSTGLVQCSHCNALTTALSLRAHGPKVHALEEERVLFVPRLLLRKPHVRLCVVRNARRVRIHLPA